MSGTKDLYDYAALRQVGEATMYVAAVDRPTLVLGGRQSPEVIDGARLTSTALRRRRGGGGLVLVQPGDLWVDWWIPALDVRWSHDVHVSSRLVGGWWREVLDRMVTGAVSVHEGSLEGVLEHRIVCFAGRGPGEVFVDGRKAVGLTQWRVREGVFVSTVIHSRSSNDVLGYLTLVPNGLAESLDHHLLSTLEIDDVESVVASLHEVSGVTSVRRISISGETA